MRLHEIITEAIVQPDENLMHEIEYVVDEANEEYQEFLEENGDVDDIDELADILNSVVDHETTPVFFQVNHKPRQNPNEWVSAMADWSEKEGEFVTIILHAKNLEGKWGPETFKDIMMKTMAHETIHFGQYSRMGKKGMKNHQSGHQKGTKLRDKTGKERDWERSYLRDPHELMAYGHDLAHEIKDSSNPHEALRNPERFREELPVYDHFRSIFPPNAKPLQRLLTYAARYVEHYKQNT